MIKSQGPSCTDAENLVIIGLFSMWAVSLCVSICFGSGTKKVFWIASLSASLHVIWRVLAENRVKLVSWFSQLVFASRFPAGSVFTEMKNEPGPLLCCHLQWNTWGETEVSPLTACECFDRDSMLRLTALRAEITLCTLSALSCFWKVLDRSGTMTSAVQKTVSARQISWDPFFFNALYKSLCGRKKWHKNTPHKCIQETMSTSASESTPSILREEITVHNNNICGLSWETYSSFLEKGNV